ncbi:zinc ribbon domain-containing protein [Burkholderia ubonensis]|uniref:zinc ribbon domain-containing protein n=1 Tax=Burkholderia ubonensis TaxID=101571 RepID=UPI002ABE0537|nr:zinc ribbon domain-containing protein [Burkholderia ubonensis]
MGFLKWITGGHAQRGHHGGGHGSGHGSSHGNGPAGRGHDRHGWGWQTPSGDGAGTGAAPLRQLACAGCGVLNAADARSCTQCGAAQRGKACSRCHSALAADARFCPACGTQAG